MTFDWSNYLQLARQLGQTQDEAAQRTAISRAYYAAFHAADEILKVKDITLDSSRPPHERVWSIYVKSPNRQCIVIGNEGFRLRNARVDADYKSDKTISPALVARCLAEAQRVMNSVPTYLPEHFAPHPANPLRTLFRKLRKYMKL